MTIKLYEVGGAVRDDLMGVPSKDVDFAVEAPSFDAMLDYIQKDLGFRVFLSKPEFLTVRAQVRADHKLRERCKDADFVLCRKDGPSTDGRRPDFVEPGTILDDLARRDFCLNAIARDPFTGDLIDPHEGQKDIETKVLRFVGDPMTRIKEDGLRVLRGFRFCVQKGLTPTMQTWDALVSHEAAEMLWCVAVERIREEVEKMFSADTIRALAMVNRLPDFTARRIFRDGLRLTPTLAKGK